MLCSVCDAAPARTKGRCRRCYQTEWRKHKAAEKAPHSPAVCRLCRARPARSPRARYCAECLGKRRAIGGSRLAAPGQVGSRRYSDGHRAGESRRRYHRNRPRHAEASHWRRVRSKYGITQHEYHEMLVAQQGRCAICQREHTEFARRLCVDHKHDKLLAEKHGQRATVRGLLCWRDNYWIVRRGVTPEMLRRAADYLERWPARSVLKGLEDVPHGSDERDS